MVECSCVWLGLLVTQFTPDPRDIYRCLNPYLLDTKESASRVPWHPCTNKTSFYPLRFPLNTLIIWDKPSWPWSLTKWVFFLNRSLFLTFCGNHVGSGRFIADHHTHLSQKGQLVHLQFCGCPGCAALLEVKLVPTDCLVLVHEFNNAVGTECDMLLIRCALDRDKLAKGFQINHALLDSLILGPYG